MNVKDITEIVASILISLGGGGGIVLAMSGWLGRIWAKRLMARETLHHNEELEKLRSQLQSDIEKLKATNEKFLNRDSKIHERQLDNLSILFQKLSNVQIDAQHCTRSFILVGENPDAYPKQLSLSFEDAYASMLSCQLYLDDDLLMLIQDFFKRVRQSQVNYAHAKDPSMPNGQYRAEAWQNAGKIAHTELPEILIQIRKKARAIIDVHQ